MILDRLVGAPPEQQPLIARETEGMLKVRVPVVFHDAVLDPLGESTQTCFHLEGSSFPFRLVQIQVPPGGHVGVSESQCVRSIQPPSQELRQSLPHAGPPVVLLNCFEGHRKSLLGHCQRRDHLHLAAKVFASSSHSAV